MSYQFNKNESNLLKEISEKYYMDPVLEKINLYIETQDMNTYKRAFDKIHDILRSSEEEVRELVKDRKSQGIITDEAQTRKSIVGNMFPYILIYIFLKNKEVGNILPYIFITSKKSQVTGFDRISQINIGEEDTQKPDCDLIIYSYRNNPQSTNEEIETCMILSLKTSMRERAAQTYKWKLLLEIANDDNCKVKEKYNITYNVENLPLICFVTVNFYAEINKPQQRGMLKFFDRAFLAKELDLGTTESFIYPLSTLAEFVNEKFCRDSS